MRALARFFLSLKTASVLFFALLLLCLIGSLILPRDLAFFSGIDDTPLFRWLSGAGDFGLTWWIYAMIALLGLLAVSTIFCTAEALLGKISRQALILKLSPQVMHMGVLLIMLGHLLTASSGYKEDLTVKKGETKPVSDGLSITLTGIKTQADENGYMADWEAEISWTEGERESKGILRPSRPVYLSGTGLFIKSVSSEPEQSALIRVSKDPGAIWALAGGILLIAGGAGFIFGRYRA